LKTFLPGPSKPDPEVVEKGVLLKAPFFIQSIVFMTVPPPWISDGYG
jgi:hypothetical protein